MRIVPVTPDLIPALSQLAVASFTETFGHLYPADDLADFLESSYAPEKLAAEVGDPREFWRLVMDDRGRAVAYLQCTPVSLPHPDADPKGHGELKRLYVLASQQGKGLGKRLLGLALDHLLETCGPVPQWIGVWSLNHKAQALYADYGFEKVGAYQFPVGRVLDDEFILRRLPQ